MRFRRTLAVAMAGAAAAAGIATSVGLPAASAQAATTSVQLPITRYAHMLVDPAQQHIFFTSGTGSTSILVTDYSGNTVATIPNEPGATGLALSSDGSTVYAALADGDAISAISTASLTETARYDTGAYTDPAYVAYTSGKVWFGDGDGIGSIDPSTSPATITPKLTNDLYGGIPMLAASPGGVLVASATTTDPATVFTYDVSSGTPIPLASKWLGAENVAFVNSMAVTPDGKDVVLDGGPSYAPVYRTSDLSADGAYRPPGAPGYLSGVSVSADGSVAVGTFALANSVSVFAPGGSTPLNTYDFGSDWVNYDGVALTPDGSELFAVTSGPAFQGAPTLNIIPDPEQVASTLSLIGPATDSRDQALTLTGTLGGTSPYTGGQNLQVTRIDPANPGGVALPDITTAADGSFSITDTPPKANVDTGTVTYQVSYTGNVHLSASTASFSVTVHYNAS